MKHDIVVRCAALSLPADPLTILGHLEKGKTITPFESMLVYGIGRLSDCILKIRNAGLKVDMVMCRDERGRKYGKYSMHTPLVLS